MLIVKSYEIEVCEIFVIKYLAYLFCMRLFYYETDSYKKLIYKKYKKKQRKHLYTRSGYFLKIVLANSIKNVS